MPAELTKAKLKRRTSRKDLEEYRFDGTHGRELELKRNRGEVSCAECRRLKIKCDKQIPCQSCQRRGCVSLCPNGSLATGQGTRFVLAATEHLHRRIASLRGRIRQLEDALSAVHAKSSSDPHPLLHEDLIQVDEQDGDADTASDEAVEKTSGEGLDAFGTLSLSDHGICRFFGRTGGSESLLLANLHSNHGCQEIVSTPNSPSSIGALSHFSHSFPLSPLGQIADVQELVETHLPPYDQTIALCDTYFEQVSWAYRCVTRMQLVDDMLPVIYKMQGAPDEDYGGPHGLALLFVVLAIGALVGKDPSNALAEHFHQLSRAAISLQPILEKPSMVTIQALHLMGVYNGMNGSDLRSETSMETTWSLVTLASQLSQTIGLHRDSARWGLSPKMIRYRRILFWDLFIGDIWQSLNTGRPPSFSVAFIDCRNIQDSDDDEEGGFGGIYGGWMARFTAECVADVTSRTLTAETPSYATIMELDCKIRAFPLPEGISSSSDDQASSFQSFVLEHVRETLLMYLHRSFFAQAIIEHPVNPLKSAYAHSFLAAYRASSTILKSIREQFNIWPNSCSRFWHIWTYAFSAAVVFGTVVTRGPRSPLAQSAMAELEQACILFSKASVYNTRAAKALPVLTKLNEKARYALALAQTETSPTSGDKGGLLWNIKQEEEDDELSIFAGHTRFVSSQRRTDSLSGTTSPPHSIRFEQSPPHYSSPRPIEPPHLSSQHQSQLQPHQHQGPRAHPGLSSSCYQHHSSTSPKTPTSNDISNRWSPSSGSGSSCDSYMAPPMDSLHYASYSSSERTHQHSTPEISSSSSPYTWSTDEVHQQVHHPLRGQQQQPVASTSTSMHHLPPPASPFPPSPSLFPSPPPLDSLFQTHHQQHHSDRHSPLQQQPMQQHQPYHVHAAPTPDLPSPHPQTQYASQYPPPPLQQSSCHSPHQNPHQRYTMYAPTGGYSLAVGSTTPSIDLADLGLASRDSRLDERWGSFIADSGLLETFRQR